MSRGRWGMVSTAQKKSSAPAHRHVHHLADGARPDGHRQALRAQARPAAGGARERGHVLLQLLAQRVAGAVLVALRDVAQDPAPLELLGDGGAAPGVGAVQEHLADALREVAPGGVQVEAERRGQPVQDGAAQVAAGDAPGEHHPFQDGDGGVAEHQLRVGLPPRPQPAARGARAVRGVEGELPRLQLRDVHPAGGAGVVLREEVRRRPAVPVRVHLHHPLRHAQRRLHRVGQARAVVGAHHQPVHHQGDVVVLAAVELGRVLQLDQLAVHAGADEALAEHLLEQVAELALAAAHQRGEHLDAGPFRPAQHLVHDLGGALAAHRLVALRAVRRAHPRPEQAQVVVHLRHRAHRGAGVAAGGLLLDGDGRGQPLDGVHVRLLHHPQELPGVRGKRLHVAPLPLGVDGVEGQRRLAAPAQPGDDGEPVAGDGDVDVLEVVLAGAADDEEFPVLGGDLQPVAAAGAGGVLVHPENLPQAAAGFNLRGTTTPEGRHAAPLPAGRSGACGGSAYTLYTDP